jgi:hypothetical protein
MAYIVIISKKASLLEGGECFAEQRSLCYVSDFLLAWFVKNKWCLGDVTIVHSHPHPFALRSAETAYI